MEFGGKIYPMDLTAEADNLANDDDPRRFSGIGSIRNIRQGSGAAILNKLCPPVNNSDRG